VNRDKPLNRRMGLARGGPIKRRTQLGRVVPLERGDGGLARRAGLQRGGPVRPVSDRRRAENRRRRAMADELFGETPMCTAWLAIQPEWCGRWADDLHEPLSRARLGSITDPENAAPLCRPCHDLVTFRPESELGWAFRLGLIRHSGLCCQGRRVCTEYETSSGDAA
jgi:hypothetical protein